MLRPPRAADVAGCARGARARPEPRCRARGLGQQTDFARRHALRGGASGMPAADAGHATCFALVRVPVAAGVAASVGAKPYVLGDGACETGPNGGLTPTRPRARIRI